MLWLWVRVKVMGKCRVMVRVRVSVMDWVRLWLVLGTQSVRDSVRHPNYIHLFTCAVEF